MADSITVTVQIKGNAELEARIKRFGISILNLSASMKDTGDYLTGFFSGEVFASRGGVIGKPWAALNARYAVQKAKKWPGRPPLMRTGLMNRSFKSNAGQLSVRIFNEASYFSYHQGGTNHLPARVMMSVDDTRQRKIVDIIAADISHKLETA